MTIPVETLCLWEQYYQRGDYAKLSLLTGIKAKGIVNYLHNGDMPTAALKTLTEYYEQKETQAKPL